jgi:hypothetical protein
MARFIPPVILGLIAVGLLIGGVEPAWWIVGLVALGLAVTIAAKASVSISGRSLRLAPYVPALIAGLAAVGLLIAGAEPAWWITALVAAGIALVVFMSSH